MRDNGFDPSDPFGEKNYTPRTIELVRFVDMRPHLSRKTLIKGLLEQEQISLIVGAMQTGKTFLALDMALHVAAGLQWFGRRVAEGGVVYIAAEAGRSIINRVCAWKFAHGYDQDDADIPFAAVTSAVDLCHADRGDLARLVDTIHGAILDPSALILVDTVSRALAGGDENSPADMGAIVNSLDHLRDEFRCHIGAVHHFGKDTGRGARGHSLLGANLDTVIEVEKDEAAKISTATVTKQRDGPTGLVIPFCLRSIELGRDEDMDPVTSCVVEPADASAEVPGPIARRREKQLSGTKAAALKQLFAAIDKGGEIPPIAGQGQIPERAKCILEEVWRGYCRRAGISQGKERAQRAAFQRARDELLAAERIGAWDGWVWTR